MPVTLIVDGGVVFTFVKITLPFAFVMMRIGATTAPRAVVDVDVVVADVVGVAVAAWFMRRLPTGGFAARVGLGVMPDVSVGDRVAVFVVAVIVDVPVGPAAN